MFLCKHDHRYTSSIMGYHHISVDMCCSRHMMQYQNEQFPDQWVRHGGHQNWTLQSLDLTSLDFHVWGLYENMVYEFKVNRREELLHQDI
jgi:hypothetical protein